MHGLQRISILALMAGMVPAPLWAATTLNPPAGTFDLHMFFKDKPRCDDFALPGVFPVPGRACSHVEVEDVLGNKTKLWRVDFFSPVQSFPNPMTLDGLGPLGGAFPNALLYAYWTDKDHKETSRLVFDMPMGAGAPEPAAWAMMLAGFGVIGWSLRRRRLLPA
nr:PEPxxWA-CTERM sorting domain-containing protein [Sandaracinobacteroides hominis]